MLPVNRNPTVAEVRRFGWIMLAAFGVLGGLLWYRGLPRTGWTPSVWGWQGSAGHIIAVVLGAVGVLFAVMCTGSYALGRRLYVVWMTGGMYLGAVVTTVLLSLMFFVLLPVFALIRFKDPLRLKLKRAGTYWEDHAPHEATLERTMRQF